MYRNANAGECPLVVDETTPSCGNSRFGCWTCTVVSKDRSMEAMIDNGEDWDDAAPRISGTSSLRHRSRNTRQSGGNIADAEVLLVTEMGS